ncbi:hypothetical protein BST83_06780 [Polaribacter filamentus]|uniref:Uncharacterized protein n=1 Tax=Polaribacter filamentus TaxID=53483 RepID=A0A2S7KWI2_9FLAO|nr:hypothetical protein [Polaribacter filamentus]PQB06888.1 hypothetical protein BST83_06780 [Polaribacter filamentus]
MKNKEITYLDDILKSLKKSQNYCLNFNQLHQEVSGYKFQKDYYEFLTNLKKSIFVTNYNLDNENSLKIACQYLKEQNLILMQDNQIRISFEGIIFLSKGGYKSELENYKKALHHSLWAYRISWLSIVLSLLLFCFSVYKTLYPNCN